ncbi:MAG: hypothetical protein JWR52_1995 [Marmoricola sp.]|nr:hypothetical protein [Marmoricola sp.]
MNVGLLWLGIAVALGALEMLTTGLVLAMLAGGALVSMIAAFMGASVSFQIVIGLAVAIALLALVRPPMIRRLHAGPTLMTGAQALIGKRALVLEPLTHAAPGRVRIGGDVWTAQPFDEDDQIEAGIQVDVVSIKGATAYVLRIQQKES